MKVEGGRDAPSGKRPIMAGSGALWKAAKKAAKTAAAAATTLSPAFAGWPTGSATTAAMSGTPTLALGALGG